MSNRWTASFDRAPACPGQASAECSLAIGAGPVVRPTTLQHRREALHLQVGLMRWGQRRCAGLGPGRGVAGAARRGIDVAVRDHPASERSFILPVVSTVVPQRNVYGPESITVPLMSERPDAENPDTTRGHE